MHVDNFSKDFINENTLLCSIAVPRMQISVSFSVALWYRVHNTRRHFDIAAVSCTTRTRWSRWSQ